jgi:hypothetical protein
MAFGARAIENPAGAVEMLYPTRFLRGNYLIGQFLPYGSTMNMLMM